MKFEELDGVTRWIDRVIQSCGEESVCGRQLRKSQRQLVGWRQKGGPVPRGTLTKIVTDVCKVVSEELLKRRTDERKK